MKKIVVAVVLLAAIGLYIKFYELPQIDKEESDRKLFGTITANEIGTIAITQGEDTFTLRNKEPKKMPEPDPSAGVDDSSDEIVGKNAVSTWTLQDQPAAILDKGRVESLASAITTAQTTKSIPANELEKDLSIYGLDKPVLTITTKVGSTTRTVLFGKQNEFVSLRYAKVSGDENLYLVNDTLFEAASKKSTEFRDKTPVSFSDESVKQVAVKAGAEELIIEPGENKSFKLTKPIAVKAQNFAVFDLFKNLRNLQADLFIDSPGDLGIYGLNVPAAAINIVAGEASVVITVGSKGDKEFFQLNHTGPVYQAVGHPLAGLSRNVDGYRDNQQFLYDHYTVTKFVVEKGNSPYLVIQKDKEDWKVNDQKGDGPFVRQYLRDVSELRASSFLPLNDAVLTSNSGVTVKVTVDDGNGPKEQVLVIGDKRGDFYPSFVQDRKEPFLLTQENIDLIIPALEKFKPVVEPTPTNVATP